MCRSEQLERKRLIEDRRNLAETIYSISIDLDHVEKELLPKVVFRESCSVDHVGLNCAGL